MFGLYIIGQEDQNREMYYNIMKFQKKIGKNQKCKSLISGRKIKDDKNLKKKYGKFNKLMQLGGQ